MSYWLIEQADYRTTKNGKEYLWLQGNNGEKRKPMYVWNSPLDMKLSGLTGKVISFLQEKDMGDYMSMSWNDATLLEVEDVGDYHPIRKIKLKGDVDGQTLLNRVMLMADKLDIHPFYKEFLNHPKVAELIKGYDTVPAGIKVHHPWVNGLSTHTEEALTALVQLSRCYFLKNVNWSVAFLALLFHDMGKLWEYENQGGFQITKDLPLLGHIYIGAEWVGRELRAFYSEHYGTELTQRTGVPEEFHQDVKLIQHCILAHHGQKEYGSPVVPATIEAYLVSVCDLISARQNMFDMATDMEKNFWLSTYVVKSV